MTVYVNDFLCTEVCWTNSEFLLYAELKSDCVRSASGLAAGNVVGGSCNIAGTVGDQEGDQVADFVELAVTSERNDLGVIGGTLTYNQNSLVKTGELPTYQNGEVTMPSGYKINYLRGYDMFAQCKGVEVLCSLSLNE